jgi:hypothetical protein
MFPMYDPHLLHIPIWNLLRTRPKHMHMHMHTPGLHNLDWTQYNTGQDLAIHQIDSTRPY